MEIEIGVAQRQRSAFFHANSVAIDKDGKSRFDCGVPTDDEVGHFHGIPAVGPQIYALLYPTLQCKDEVVLDQ